MFEDCLTDPVANWARLAGGWVVMCVVIAVLLGWLAAVLEGAMDPDDSGSAFHKPFNAFIENVFLFLVVVGLFFFLNLAFTIWDTRFAPEEFTGTWRAITIGGVFVLLLLYREVCVTLAKWWRHHQLRMLRTGQGPFGTASGDEP